MSKASYAWMPNRDDYTYTISFCTRQSLLLAAAVVGETVMLRTEFGFMKSTPQLMNLLLAHI